jgi:hypothetical protein
VLFVYLPLSVGQKPQSTVQVDHLRNGRSARQARRATGAYAGGQAGLRAYTNEMGRGRLRCPRPGLDHLHRRDRNGRRIWKTNLSGSLGSWLDAAAGQYGCGLPRLWPPQGDPSTAPSDLPVLSKLLTFFHVLELSPSLFSALNRSMF